MKITYTDDAVKTIAISELGYSHTFRFPMGTCCPGADPTKLYVRVQTKQRYVCLKKPDFMHMNCARALSLSDTVLICIPLDTQIIPVDAEVVVLANVISKVS
jgi:hypothetical protein